MITDAARYYGAVFSFIIDRSAGSVALRRIFDDCVGFYLVDERLPLLIKYSTRRKGPWSFTFHHDHQEKQQMLYERHGECIVALVCGKDGIVALQHADFRTVLDEFFEPQEAVTVRRRHNQMYQVKGRDGQLSRRLSRSSLSEALQSTKDEVIIPS